MVKTCTKCGVEKGLEEFAVKRTGKDGRASECNGCGRERCRAYYERNAEKRKEAVHAYYKANAEQVKERQRAYYKANAERVNERDRAYRRANREEINERRLAWRKANPEKVSELNRAYRRANPEKVSERLRAWQKANPDKVRAITHRRRARKAAAPGTATAAQIAARCAMFGNKCWVCGAPAEAIDHVKPLAAGGSGWPCNLRPICRSCNSRKGAKWPLAEFAAQAGVA